MTSLPVAVNTRAGLVYLPSAVVHPTSLQTVIGAPVLVPVTAPQQQPAVVVAAPTVAQPVQVWGSSTGSQWVRNGQYVWWV